MDYLLCKFFVATVKSRLLQKIVAKTKALPNVLGEANYQLSVADFISAYAAITKLDQVYYQQGSRDLWQHCNTSANDHLLLYYL